MVGREDSSSERGVTAYAKGMSFDSHGWSLDYAWTVKPRRRSNPDSVSSSRIRAAYTPQPRAVPFGGFWHFWLLAVLRHFPSHGWGFYIKISTGWSPARTPCFFFYNRTYYPTSTNYSSQISTALGLVFCEKRDPAPVVHSFSSLRYT